MQPSQTFEMSSFTGDFAKLSASMRNRLDSYEPSSTSPPPTSDDNQARVCAICSKRFKRTEHLKRHARSHEPGPFLPCDQCDRSFLRSDSLRRHKKIHNRAKEDENPSEAICIDTPTTTKQSRPRIFNRACRPCARARVRCDGQHPCERCVTSEIACERVRKKKFSVATSTSSTTADSAPSPRSVYSSGDTTQTTASMEQDYLEWTAELDTDNSSVTSSAPHDGDLSPLDHDHFTDPFAATSQWPSSTEDSGLAWAPTAAMVDDPQSMAALCYSPHAQSFSIINDASYDMVLQRQNVQSCYPQLHQHQQQADWMFLRDQTQAPIPELPEIPIEVDGYVQSPYFLGPDASFQPVYV